MSDWEGARRLGDLTGDETMRNACREKVVAFPNPVALQRRDDIEEQVNGLRSCIEAMERAIAGDDNEIVRAFTLDCMDEHLTTLTTMLFPAP
jgi:hypothetical protein